MKSNERQCGKADIKELVEALERISNMDSMSYHSLETAKIVARNALAALQPTEQKPECGCCGQTDVCDDDCDAVVIGGHGAKQLREPCHECGGNGAGGEHENDCPQQPDVAQPMAAEQSQVRYEARDLRVKAEAINQAINNYFNTDNGPHGLKENLEWQAQRLRERADEAEQSYRKGGGV